MGPFLVRAVNTAADAENRIHDDRVAAEYGFRGGLVPGITVYGYMAAAVIEHFGPAWLNRGAMDVRFRQPVYHGDEVSVTLHQADRGRLNVEIAGCASAVAWIEEGAIPEIHPRIAPLNTRVVPSEETLAPGTVLGMLKVPLDLKAATISAPLDPEVHGVAQPAVLISLANQLFVRNYELGPWIHVSSEVRKFQPARDCEELCVSGWIEDRFERKGHEFVTLQVDIAGPKGPVEHIRHTAIWRPRAT